MSNWQHLGDIAERVFVTDARRRLDNAQEGLEWCTIEEKAILYGEFKGWAEAHGKKPTYATFLYKERFHEWPSDNVKATPALDCTPATSVLIQDIVRDFWRTQKRKGRK